jgi:hypothetical protein
MQQALAATLTSWQGYDFYVGMLYLATLLLVLCAGSLCWVGRRILLDLNYPEW